MRCRAGFIACVTTTSRFCGNEGWDSELRPPRKRGTRQKEYAILLPLRFNNGEPVPAELILQTRDELVQRFGGASFDPGFVEGYWVHAARTYSDELIRVRVSAQGTAADDQFILDLKERLKLRFQQEEIYVTASVIERF